MNTHVLNESEKRFDPMSKNCCYCSDNYNNTNVNHIIYTSVYKELDRSNIVVYRNVKFQEVKIGNPCCDKCKNTLKTVNIVEWLYIIFSIFMILVSAVFVGIYISSTILAIILALVVSFFGFVLVGKKLSRFILKKNKVLSRKEAASKVPLIKEFLWNGWSLDRPSP